MKSSRLAPLLLALSLATGAAGAQETTQSSPALSVEIASPESQIWPVRLETNGRMQAWHEALIAAETGGQRIESVNGDVGSVVNKGDVLAQLSTDTLKNTIIQQEATVLSAEAALEQAKADADRARTLRSGHSTAISDQQVTEYLVTERKADADLASAKAALASTQLDLERTTILAPDDGVISSRSASMGNVVASGTELFRLIRQSRIEWQAEVPIRFLGHIKEGTEVAIPTPIGTEVLGKVRLISPTASETTGRVIVYCAMTPPADAPMPKIGMMVSGHFNLGDTEALTVPASATSMRDGFIYVFVVNEGAEPTTVTRKRVEIGRRNDDRVEILSGIEVTDQIVQAGGAFLSEGSVVNVVNNPAKDAEASQ
ncbi:efflux RND transporter periplasmic adaptor subunit [Paracoccus aestuariivivens]|uniref:Efflux RND transporter periplasmic adaptor subunit n=1 Tax=Paracoccus aestuariivivens TaxID=1820333 RepID=A0A6L6JDQ8_9RHOB|nr:efflux RND transporter periplasmic adaptor subunit [Paracoccus aestuariivivens]MTH80120.1 efflux RND transporter periplasmic adaptor subunit [Paracoccus aestuariivivens]